MEEKHYMIFEKSYIIHTLRERCVNDVIWNGGEWYYEILFGSFLFATRGLQHIKQFFQVYSCIS